MSSQVVVELDVLRQLRAALGGFAAAPAQVRETVMGRIRRCEARLADLKSRANADKNSEEIRRLNNLERELEGVSNQAFRTLGRLDHIAANLVPKAEARLDRLIRDLERYRTERRIAQALLVAGEATIAGMFLKQSISRYASGARNRARDQAWRQESRLVNLTGRGTREWEKPELDLLSAGKRPSGYYAHHINNVARFPELAENPDNIAFVKGMKGHLAAHRGRFTNNTSGKLFNRKSLMVQWASRKDP